MTVQIDNLWIEIVGKAPRYLRALIDHIPTQIDPTDLAVRLREEIYPALASVTATERDAYVDLVCARWHLKKRTVRAEISGHEPEPEKEVREVRMHGAVLQDEGNFYYVRLGDEEVRISSFVLKPIEHLVEEEDKTAGTTIVCQVELMGQDEPYRQLAFPPKTWSSRNDFVRYIADHPRMQWSGTNDNVQAVHGILGTYDVPNVRATKILGRIETSAGPRWVWPGGVLGPDGPDPMPIRYVGESVLAGRLDYPWLGEAETRSIAARVLPRLLDLNERHVVIPILGWFYATAWTPIVRRLGSESYPILWVWGSPMAGKTTLVRDVFWPLMGVASSRHCYSVTDTAFATYAALDATRTIPQIWDEYRTDVPEDKRRAIERVARRVYGGESETRGRADLRLKTMSLLAPMVVVGETMPIDTALCDRLIVSSPLRMSLTPAREATMEAVRREPLAALAASWTAWSLRTDPRPLLELARGKRDAWCAAAGIQGLGPRPRDNLLVMVLGLCAFEMWAASLGVTGLITTEPEVLQRIVAEMIGESDAAEGSNGHAGGNGRHDALDRFLLDCADLARAGLLKEDVHYARVEGALCVHLRSCYRVYMERQRQAGLRDETQGLAALQRIAREKLTTGSSYVLRTDQRVRLEREGGGNGAPRPPSETGEGQVPRCMALDIRTVNAVLDLCWPVHRTRTQGGYRRSGETSDYN